MKAWSFLFASGILQIGWLVALRETQGFTRVVPIVFYALFGLSSTYCLAKALEGIPMSTAYAVWTGISVVGSVIVDPTLFTRPNLLRIACILLVVAGVAGLKILERPIATPSDPVRVAR